MDEIFLAIIKGMSSGVSRAITEHILKKPSDKEETTLHKSESQDGSKKETNN